MLEAAWPYHHLPYCGEVLLALTEFQCCFLGRLLQISHFKIPHYVSFVESFPLTVSGKVRKFKMRQMAVEMYGLQKQSSLHWIGLRTTPADTSRTGLNPVTTDGWDQRGCNSKKREEKLRRLQCVIGLDNGCDTNRSAHSRFDTFGKWSDVDSYAFRSLHNLSQTGLDCFQPKDVNVIVLQ